MYKITRLAALAPVLLALTLAACGDAHTTASTNVAVGPSDASLAAVPASAALQQELAALRRSTAPYHNIEKAKADKFADKITSCWYHGSLGAMGYHYADVQRLDGTIDPLKPEALVYEPLAGGKLSLVAVEYIVPIAAWQGTSKPSLYGLEFDRNDALGLYVMHVWAWRENPAGMFAAWNPNVSCQYAADSEDRGATH
jgi:hypothetical protein